MDPPSGQKVSRDAGLYAYGRIAASILQLVTLALAARIYDGASFAYISSLLLLYEGAVALGSFGLPDAVFYFIGRQPERAPEVVRQTSLLLLLIAIPVTGVVMVAGGAVATKVSIAGALPWLALVLLVELPTQPAVNQLIAVGHAGLASALYVGFAAIRPMAALAPALFHTGVGLMPVLMAGFGLLRLVAHLAIVGRFFPRRGPWADTKALKTIAAFALPAGLAVLGGKLNPQIDKYVVELVRGRHDFNLYTAAAWEVPLVSLIPYAIGAVTQARYTRLYADRNLDELRALWLATVRKTTTAVVPLSVLLIALGRPLVVLVAGEKFAPAAPLFQIFTIILLHRVASYGAMLQAIGETPALLVTSTAMIVTNLILTYPLARLLGFPGAAIATVLANVPPFLYSLHRIARGLEVPIRKVMPWAFYGATLSLAGALAVGTWLLVRTFAPGTALLVGAAVFLPAFVIAGRLTGIVAREDLAYLRRWVTFSMLKR